MSIKRTIIVTVAIAASVAMVAPMLAGATTVSDLMAQIAQLQTQLNSLSGSTTTTTSGNVPAACIGVTFTRNLVVGSTGSDVKCLQVILNLSASTQVSATGAGAPGYETTYFGSRTLVAVRIWQAQAGFVPANQVGPMSRAKLNAWLGGTTTTTTTTTTTGLPAGCTVASGYSPTTGASCAAATNLPAGCTSTAGFSPTTGASCTTGTVIVIPTPGATGFIDAGTLAASPASNANVTTTSNVPVLGVNIKAINSNMTVNSLKVQLAVTKSAAAEHPSTLINKLYVYDGSTLLGTFGVDTNSVYKTSAGLYYVILSGFNFVVPANTTKVLTVSADFAPALETSRILTINLFDTTAVGAIDGTGASRTGGVATTRVYTITYSTVGTSTLTGTASVNTPIASSVNVNTTSGTTDVPMLVFNAKSTVGASKLTDLVFTVVATDVGMFNKVTAIKLYDGTALLGSVTPVVTSGGTGTATFSNLVTDIALDATKVLTVKANIADMNTPTDTTSGDTVYVTITPTSQFTFTTPNLSTGTPVGSIITGKTMHFFDGEAAVLSFVSGTSTYTYNTTTPSLSYTTGVITFDMKADGGELTKLLNTKVDAYWNTTNLLADANVNVSVSPDTVTADGNTARVTVTMTVSRDVTTPGFVDFKIGNDTSTGIQWTVGGSGEVNQYWGLIDYKTPFANAR